MEWRRMEGKGLRNAKCGRNGEKMKKEGSAMQVLKRRGQVI